MFVTITFTKMIILTKYILYLFFVFLTIRHPGITIIHKYLISKPIYVSVYSLQYNTLSIFVNNEFTIVWNSCVYRTIIVL